MKLPSFGKPSKELQGETSLGVLDSKHIVNILLELTLDLGTFLLASMLYHYLQKFQFQNSWQSFVKYYLGTIRRFSRNLTNFHVFNFSWLILPIDS